jgi:intracellular multiplication protein IcmJ
VKKLMSLLVGIIQDPALFRNNSNARLRADAEYKAVRPRVMAQQENRCRFCGYTSKHNHCHHLDGNHANNEPENFAVADSLCHAYHHLGQTGSQDQFSHDNLRTKTVLAAVPELSPSDLNLLQRAIGVALLDQAEEATAKQIYKLIEERAEPVREAFGTFRPADFAGAMEKLNPEEYANRGSTLADLRLVFREDMLKNEGRRFLEDFTSLPFSLWEGATKHAQNSR